VVPRIAPSSLARDEGVFCYHGFGRLMPPELAGSKPVVSKPAVLNRYFALLICNNFISGKTRRRGVHYEQQDGRNP